MATRPLWPSIAFGIFLAHIAYVLSLPAVGWYWHRPGSKHRTARLEIIPIAAYLAPVNLVYQISSEPVGKAIDEYGRLFVSDVQ